jgi:hypothetical protein
MPISLLWNEVREKWHVNDPPTPYASIWSCIDPSALGREDGSSFSRMFKHALDAYVKQIASLHSCADRRIGITGNQHPLFMIYSSTFY